VNVSKSKKNRAVQLDPKQNQHEKVDERPAEVFTQVSVRAYEIFAARGFAPGHDLDDWLLAERQMLGRRVHTLVDSWTKQA
jgi:hypothetical protein